MSFTRLNQRPGIPIQGPPGAPGPPADAVPLNDILPPTGDVTLADHRLISVADVVEESDGLNLRSAEARYATPNGTDAYGRNTILGTSTVQAPALRQFVSVTDAPWNTPNDSRRVLDGSMSSSTNPSQLVSPTANFSSADVGKSCQVVGAGDPAVTGKRLTTTVAAFIDNDTVTLASPALSTVSGALVTIGTDATSTFQTAHDAVSNAGGGRLHVPAQGAYLITRVKMRSNVFIDARNATFHMYYDVAINNCGFQNSKVAGDVAISNWTMLGGILLHDNIDYPSGTMIDFFSNVIQSTDIRVEGVTVLDNPDSAVLFYAQRCWVINNTFKHVCFHLGGRNCVNIEANAANWGIASDVTVHGNVFDTIQSHALNVGSNGGSQSASVPIRCTVTANKFVGSIGVAIAMELGDDGTGRGINENIVANNHIHTTVTVNGACSGIALGGGNGVDEMESFRWIVQGNTVFTDGDGITINVDDCTCQGNVIYSNQGNIGGNGCIGSSRNGFTLTVTTDGTTAVLTGVTFPAAEPAHIQLVTNAMVIGTGIVNGSYIVGMNSGAGTITLNTPTTAAGTVTATFAVGMRGVVIMGNSCRIPVVAASINGMTVNNLRDSIVSNNTVTFDPGNTNINGYGISLLNSFNTSVESNRISNCTKWGVYLTRCHDIDIISNKIRNPNQATGAPDVAMSFTDCFNITMESNKAWDDTSSSKLSAMYSVTTGTGHRALRNRIRGETSTSPFPNTGTVMAEIRGNNTLTAGHNSAPPIAAITPGASPYTYTNTDPFPQRVIISGGTISRIDVGRAGSSASIFNVIQTSGVFFLDVGDSVKVTYTVTPVVFEKFPMV